MGFYFIFLLMVSFVCCKCKQLPHFTWCVCVYNLAQINSIDNLNIFLKILYNYTYSNKKTIIIPMWLDLTTSSVRGLCQELRGD